MSRRDEFGFGLQHDLETANNTVVFSPPVLSGGLSPDREEMNIDETMGSRAPSAQDYGGYVFDGDVEAAARPNHLGGIFSMFWGEPVGSDPVTGTPSVYEHEWDPLIADPVFATVVTKANDPNPAIVNKFIGALGNELTINVAANEYLTYTANMVARQIILDPTPTPSMTREALPKWTFTDVNVLLGVAGATPEVIKCKEWELGFNNNLVTDEFILGTPLVDSIPLGDIDMTAMFRPTRDISDHNRRWLKTNPELIQLQLQVSGRLIGATTERYKLTIDIGALETVEADVPLDGSETLRDVEVNCRCILNEDTGKLLTAKIRNAYAGTGYLAPAA